METNQIYDIIIVGGGPAGMTAAVYSARSNLKTLLIEEYMCGGQTLNTYEIKNYPGFENVSGPELSQNMEKQVKSLGVEEKFEKVIDFNFDSEIKVVKTQKNQYTGKAVILCLGAKPRKLGLESEIRLTGKGISYCSICDGGFFKNKTVAIVGGGNSAMEDVLYLTNLAKKTYLINRTERFRAIPTLVESVMTMVKDNKIELLSNSIVQNINGEHKLESIDVKNTLTGDAKNIQLDGLFIEIGRKPDTEFLKGKIELDSDGYILTDENLMTSQNGVFCAGDARQKTIRQIVTACSDGAVASTFAGAYIQSKRK